MRKVSIIVTLMLFSATFVFAGESRSHYEELYNTANKYYSENGYQEAIDTYKKIINAGYESPALFFNLGNSFFKLGDIPSSVLYYEKAKRLSPNDADILFNLNLANQRIKDKIEPLPKLFYKQWWDQIVASSLPDRWAWITIFLLLFGLTGMGLYIANTSPGIRRLCFWSGVAVLLLALITFNSGLHHYTVLNEHNEAIVFAPAITVRSSPNPESTQLFVIHEGTKVKVLETVDQWYKISLPDGNIGWLEEEEVEII